MTVFETVTTTSINEGALNTTENNLKGQDEVSCFGLPGQNKTHAYCRVDIEVDLAVTSGEKIYARIKSGKIQQNNIEPALYPSYLDIRERTFNAEPSFPSRPVARKDDITVGSDRVFTWSFPTRGSIPLDKDIDPADYGLVYLGFTLSDIKYDESNHKGYMYVGGSAVYAVTDPLKPAAEEIEITGFEDLLDYYPWSVRRYEEDDSGFLSCNRDGGFLKRYTGSSWSKVKNKNTSSNTDQLAFRYAGDSWAKAKKTGIGKDEN